MNFPHTSAHKVGGMVILSLRPFAPIIESPKLLVIASESWQSKYRFRDCFVATLLATMEGKNLLLLTSSVSQRQRARDCFGTVVLHNYREDELSAAAKIAIIGLLVLLLMALAIWVTIYHIYDLASWK